MSAETNSRSQMGSSILVDSTLSQDSLSIYTVPIVPLCFKGWGILLQGKDVREAGRLIRMALVL